MNKGQRKPEARGTLTRARPSEDSETNWPMGNRQSHSLHGSPTQKEWQSFPGESVRELISVSMCREQQLQPPAPSQAFTTRASSLQRPPTETSQPLLLGCTAGLYIVNAEVQHCLLLEIRERDPSFTVCVCLCLSFLPILTAPSRGPHTQAPPY